jgi:hypothetical protein
VFCRLKTKENCSYVFCLSLFLSKSVWSVSVSVLCPCPCPCPCPYPCPCPCLFFVRVRVHVRVHVRAYVFIRACVRVRVHSLSVSVSVSLSLCPFPCLCLCLCPCPCLRKAGTQLTANVGSMCPCTYMRPCTRTITEQTPKHAPHAHKQNECPSGSGITCLHGQCEQTPSGSLACVCDPGFRGLQCAVPVQDSAAGLAFGEPARGIERRYLDMIKGALIDTVRLFVCVCEWEKDVLLCFMCGLCGRMTRHYACLMCAQNHIHIVIHSSSQGI